LNVESGIEPNAPREHGIAVPSDAPGIRSGPAATSPLALTRACLRQVVETLSKMAVSVLVWSEPAVRP
jgi:hypothetical protein